MPSRLALASVMMRPSPWVSISLWCDVVWLFGEVYGVRVRSRVEWESLKSFETHIIKANKLAERALVTCCKQNKLFSATRVIFILPFIHSLSSSSHLLHVQHTHTHPPQEMQYGSGIRGHPSHVAVTASTMRSKGVNRIIKVLGSPSLLELNRTFLGLTQCGWRQGSPAQSLLPLPHLLPNSPHNFSFFLMEQAFLL